MSRLEALLVLLGSAAMVVRLHCDGSHVAATACFESERNRRHFEGVLAKNTGVVSCKCGTRDNFGRCLSIGISLPSAEASS